jgi:hypothetical protein
MGNDDGYPLRSGTRSRKAMRDLFAAPAELTSTRLTPLPRPPRLTPVQRRLLEANAAILQELPDEIAYLHTVFCQIGLPTRRESARKWRCEQGRALLLIEAGSAYHPEKGDFVELPLPFGPKARIVQMHLDTEAVRRQSPIIPVGDSLTAFVRRLMRGHEPAKRHDPNGREIRAYKEQLSALAAATVRLAVRQDEQATQISTQIIAALDLWFSKDTNKRVLWPSTVQLSSEYFNSLTEYGVPLDERAIAALSQSSRALDAYAWLAQRLHRIEPGKMQFVPWAALHRQFGEQYTYVRFFRRDFRKILKEVQAVYPDARFDAQDSDGMRLWQSRPPVAKRLVAISAPAIAQTPSQG